MKKLLLIIFVFAGFSVFSQTVKEQADEYFKQGEQHLYKKEYKKAVEYFTKVITLDNGDVEAYAFRGQAYHYMEKFKEAMDDYNKALEIEPNYAEVYHLRGMAKGEMKDDKGACTDWEKAYELGVTDALELLEKFCNK